MRVDDVSGNIWRRRTAAYASAASGDGLRLGSRRRLSTLDFSATSPDRITGCDIHSTEPYLSTCAPRTTAAQILPATS